VRRGFVDHLYHALTSAGFSVFLDTYQIKRGDDISAALQHAIEVSHILIPIFSHNYARSTWCLKEVSLIVHEVLRKKRKDNESAVAIPLFYDVTPSHVRHPDQSHGSPFAEAFQERERSWRYSPQEIDEWKAALFTLSNISGWSLQEDTNGWVTHHCFLFFSILICLYASAFCSVLICLYASVCA